MTQISCRLPKVLVVEDEPIISRICERTLRTEGFEVDIAPNGFVAKSMIADKRYDICFSDIRTPRMNGIELYRHLEQKYPELALNVIFTTGDVLSSNVDRFLKEVDRPYLAKPFTPDQLRQILNKAFADRQRTVAAE